MLPIKNHKLIIRGFEGEDEAEGDETEEETTEESETDDEEESEEEDEPDPRDVEIERLKAKLKKKEGLLKKYQGKGSEEGKGEKKEQQSDGNDAESKARLQALTTRLRDASVDNAVTRLAAGMNFVDMDDVLRLIDRRAIEVDQDEDDPSEVEVDDASVKEALKALAKKKPHLVRSSSATGSAGKTGDKFGGKKKATKEADAEALRKKYPALGGRR